MDNAFQKQQAAGQESIETPVEQRAFAQWCEMNGVHDIEMPRALDTASKAVLYDTVLRKGAENLTRGFLAQPENAVLDITQFKSELNALRRSENLVALGKKEEEIAKVFQKAISAYEYESTTDQPVEILDKKAMNCVGASLLGGTLLEQVGIRAMLAQGKSHDFIVVVTSDNRVLWQDMQDGREIQATYNGELTAGKIERAGEKDAEVVLREIVAFAQKPTNEGLTFVVNKPPDWQGEPIQLLPLRSGIEESELVNTGFNFNNDGKFAEGLEILRIAAEKPGARADAYLGMAKSLRGLGRYAEAITACKKAFAIDPTYSHVEDEMKEIIELQK